MFNVKRSAVGCRINDENERQKSPFGHKTSTLGASSVYTNSSSKDHRGLFPNFQLWFLFKCTMSSLSVCEQPGLANGSSVLASAFCSRRRSEGRCAGQRLCFSRPCEKVPPPRLPKLAPEPQCGQQLECKALLWQR